MSRFFSRAADRRRAAESKGPSFAAADTPPPPSPAAAAAVIPVDFTVVKKALRGDGMALYDSCGHLVFRVAAAGGCCRGGRALLDAAGSTLVTVANKEGEWQAFKGNVWEGGEIIFTAKAIPPSANQKEVHVFAPRSSFEDVKPSYRLIGSPFRRACTVIKGNSIVAQTSLPYKLKKAVYSRCKFRVTVYPGNDHVLVMAMIVTFFT